MEFINQSDIKVHQNEGFVSHQLIVPENTSAEHVPILRVIVQPAVKNERRCYEYSKLIM